jgi:hypothetical protein
VNVEAEYHEHTSDGETSPTGRDAPVFSREALDAAAQARSGGSTAGS